MKLLQNLRKFFGVNYLADAEIDLFVFSFII